MLEIAKLAKTALTGIEGVQSVGIGIEPNLAPKDYPMIRIVPVESRPDNSLSHYHNVQLDIYIGLADKFAKDGYEAIYQQLDNWEAEVVNRLNQVSGAAFFWKYTKQDEDRLQNVKVICLRVEGIG
jgi:hypothetical protein